MLATLVEAWETKHYPIEAPAPIEVIKYRMEVQGLTHRDLEPMLGSWSRASEVARPPAVPVLNNVRRLSSHIHIPADLLIQTYALENKPPKPRD